MSESDPMRGFHPEIAAWMRARQGPPTPIQRQAWPAIAAGQHVLATAPTGSGKTLGAFLWAIDRLLQRHWQPGTVRVLYVSPLKALNNDIRRNLLGPLAALHERFRERGLDCPPLRVATRSGDTPAAERRRMAREPPEILITTPESLTLLLASASGRGMLGGVRTLIVDEVHALAGNRRGVALAAAMEGLVDLAGEVQRIGLSATVRPIAAIAMFLGGYPPAADGRPGELPRPVRTLETHEAPRLDLRIEAFEPDPLPEDGGFDGLAPIARAIRARSEHNRSTLVFCNSRQLAEKLAFRVNETAGTTLAWAHHGSLARSLRTGVEARLKAGELRAIVATSSLEMGIDIGALDEVVMVQCPPSVTSTLQRIGRAGHQVGATSRAVLHPTHPHDLLAGIAAIDCAARGDIEPSSPLRNCLDVLAQILLAGVLPGPVPADSLYDRIRRAAPYRHLDRAAFDAVVDMLCGRHAGSRIRELRPRIHRDGDRLVAARGAALTFYSSGGVIPDRGYFQLRHAHSQTRIGELDEEFVWEHGPGRAFSLGSQQWRVQRITHNDVFVLPAPEARHAPPFWRAEEGGRDAHLSARIATLLEAFESCLAAGRPVTEAVAATATLDRQAAAMLHDYLTRQRRHTGTALPHRHHLVVERVASGPGAAPTDAGQLVLHTVAGRALNRPWALALEAAWETRFGDRPEIHAGDDALVIQLEAGMEAEAVLDLVHSANLDALLRRRLAGSGFFGARFRECAGRALLLPRRRFGERQPLWLNRLHSQRLLGRLGDSPDFPVLAETWRTCMEDEFDLPALRRMLDALEAGDIRVSTCTTATPSPFVAQLTRAQIGRYMYADDTPRSTATAPGLLDTLLDEADLRPRIDADTVARFLRRQRRQEPGWQPRDRLDLMDWIAERRFLGVDELEVLRSGLPADEWPQVEPELARIDNDRGAWITLAQDAATLRALVDGRLPPETHRRWLQDWLGAQPPATADALAAAWPGPRPAFEVELAALTGEGIIIHGPVIQEDSTERYVLRSSLEAMLRQQRARRRHLAPLPATEVADFLIDWQRLGRAVDLLDALEPLRGLALPAERWEDFVLPARLTASWADALEHLLAAGDILIYGAGRPRLGFALPEELEALPAPAASEDPLPPQLPREPGIRLPFAALVTASADDPRAAATAYWDAFWAGRITFDGFETVRRGLQWRFTLPAGATADDDSRLRDRSRRGTGMRGLRRRIRTRVAGYPGHFAFLPRDAAEADALSDLERARDRARILLDRWGVVAPELCRREAPGMTWGSVFRALRWLELAGEITGGHFLEGLGGPQFATPEALERIRAWQPGIAPPRWLHAQDPASPCALGLPLGGLPLPAARRGNELVLGSGRVLLTWSRGNGDLRLDTTLDASQRDDTLAVFAAAQGRRSVARRRLTLHTLNDQPARHNPCMSAFEPHFHIGADHRAVTLEPRTGPPP